MGVFMYSTIRKLLSVSLLYYLLVSSSFAQSSAVTNLKVVTSIAPVNSIVSSIMQGVGKPNLLANPGQSGHHAALKPSQARKLANADLVFWIGPGMEDYLVQPIKTLATSALTTTLLRNPQMHLIPTINGNHDPHIWLSLGNAKVMAKQITEVLQQADEANEQRYSANLTLFEKRVDGLHSRLEKQLHSSETKSILIYHNSLGYFAEQFSLDIHPLTSGSEELGVSAKQIAMIGKLAKSGNYGCLLYEAGHNAEALKIAAQNAGLPAIQIDPLGVFLSGNRQTYSGIMQNIGIALSECRN